ncbi:MAG: HAMP domain-containing sensor histidine kinase [bacterium]
MGGTKLRFEQEPHLQLRVNKESKGDTIASSDALRPERGSGDWWTDGVGVVDDRTRLLLDVSRNISARGDLREKLGRAHRLIADALGADFVGTAREDPTLRESRILHHFGVPSDTVADVERVRVPRGGIFGGHLSGGKTLVLSAAETRALLPYELGERLSLSTLVLVPLVVRGNVYGALLAGTSGVNVLPPAGAEILEAIAAQIASAIEAAEVEERQREEAAASKAAARISTEILAALDKDSVIGCLCEVARRELHGDSSCFFLAQEDGSEFKLSEAIGLEQTEGEALRAVPIPRQVAEEAVGLIERDVVLLLSADDVVEAVPVAFREAYGIRELVAIAILRGAQLVGVLTIGWRQTAPKFGDRQRKISGTLSTTGSLAFERSAAMAVVAETSRIKSDLIATISHELRTPLNVILGYSEMLLDGELGNLESGQHDVLGRLDRSARGLASIINATLDLGRLEAGRMPVVSEAFDLPALVHQIVKECAETFRRAGVDVRVQFSGVDGPLKFDQGRLRLILTNLVGNAFKYTFSGLVQVSMHVSDESLEIRVFDTGQGISNEDTETIFESFHQIRTSQTEGIGGVGLGLYVVRQVVNDFDGKIWVDSQVGVGSRFHVRLPRVAKPLGRLAAKAATAAGSAD